MFLLAKMQIGGGEGILCDILTIYAIHTQNTSKHSVFASLLAPKLQIGGSGGCFYVIFSATCDLCCKSSSSSIFYGAITIF